MIILLCTTKYDADYFDVSKDRKLQNKQRYNIVKHLQTSKKRILQNKFAKI
jgi:hypothetical protein